MINKKQFIFGAFFLVAAIACISLAAADFYTGNAYSSVSQQPYSPKFQTTYTSADRSTYWPILGNEADCKARTDILLNVAPAGCQPAVVRSDLLAEQNVPVFCQVDALRINPLITITKIDNIRFTGKYPEQVSATGFHPARAALSNRDILLDGSLINNIGYVVVVLKKTENEKLMPNRVDLNLTAQIKYTAGNAFGVGKAEFRLKPQPVDAEWEANKFTSSFWDGRYYARLMSADPLRATIVLYKGNSKISEQTVEKGKTSEIIYLPGGYCQAGLQVAYDGLQAAIKKVSIEVRADGDSQAYDLYEGSKFMDDKCQVERIEVPNEQILQGNIQILQTLKGKPAGNYNADGSIFSGDSRNAPYTINSLGAVLINNNGAWDYIGPSDYFFPGRVSIRCGAYPFILELKRKTADTSASADPELTGNEKIAFDKAIAEYENISINYHAEKDASSNLGQAYGETALVKAIKLAGEYKQKAVKARLLQKLKLEYPDSTFYDAETLLEQVYAMDDASKLLNLDNKNVQITIKSIALPEKDAKAIVAYGGAELDPLQVGNAPIALGTSNDGTISVASISPDSASLQVVLNDKCKNQQGGNSRTITLKKGTSDIVCGNNLLLKEVKDIDETAVIRILPYAKGTETQANLSVSIGIEKRAIQLSPERTKERIKNLNETIAKWEGITERLTKMVEGMKGACLATSAALTVKNLVLGGGGKALARTDVIKTWNAECQIELDQKKFTTMDACLANHNSEIESQVTERANAYDAVNKRMKAIEDNNKVEGSGILGGAFGGESIKRNEAAVEYCNDINERRKTTLDCDNGYNNYYTYEQLRTLDLNYELQGSSNPVVSNSANKNIDLIKADIQKKTEAYADVQNLKKVDWMPAVYDYSNIPGRTTISTSTKDVDDKTRAIVGADTQIKKTAAVKTYDGIYLLGLDSNGVIKSATPIDGNGASTGTTLTDAKDNNGVSTLETNFRTKYKIGTVNSVDAKSYQNPISGAKVQYYETGTYKGMPALVPFDLDNGWYAATKQTTASFGNMQAFDSSGMPATFFLGNAGPNHVIEFSEGGGDDTYEMIYVNSQAQTFPGLTQEQTKAKINDAVRALREAADQYGRGNTITVLGRPVDVGRSAVNIPGMQCQNLMSASDCQLMFNVCDPVICPNSRCDLGGTYPVADVIQTGVVGGVFLCLPNFIGFKGDVYVPFCLSGINAGIQGYTSILKAHRDCLQENLNSGKMIGICDEYTAVYTCEFFWRQIAPFAKTLIPKLLEFFYGGFSAPHRGGGEYATAAAAWANAEKSIKYFTQTYAKTSLNGFKANSIEEIGTEVCRARLSASGPTSFKAITKADSPPQFHATFSSIRYSDATVPPTAQYKVFYHIFAGNSQGVYFQVYLKNPAQLAYTAIPDSLIVDSGYIATGAYKDEAKDFTAPEGYKNLCVVINGEEKCGFQDVSTSFALNIARDTYVQNQANEKGATSDAECVGGSPSIGGLLTSINPQAAAEEAAMPEMYTRGVTRICSSKNPGEGIDKTRYTEVGTCDDPNMKCWLDKTSVQNALSSNNKGALALGNLTNLDNLGKIINPKTLESGAFNYGQSIGTLDDLDAQLSQIEIEKSQVSFTTTNELSKPDNAAAFLASISKIRTSNQLLLNSHKARLDFIQANLFGKVADALVPVPTTPVPAPTQEQINKQKEAAAKAAQTTPAAPPAATANQVPLTYPGVSGLYYDKTSKRIMVKNSGSDGDLRIAVVGLDGGLTTIVIEDSDKTLFNSLGITDAVLDDLRINYQISLSNNQLVKRITPVTQTGGASATPAVPVATANQVPLTYGSIKGLYYDINRFAIVLEISSTEEYLEVASVDDLSGSITRIPIQTPEQSSLLSASGITNAVLADLESNYQISLSNNQLVKRAAPVPPPAAPATPAKPEGSTSAIRLTAEPEPITLKEVDAYADLKGKIPSIIDDYFRPEVIQEMGLKNRITFVDIDNPVTEFEKQQALEWTSAFGYNSPMAAARCPDDKTGNIIIKIKYSKFDAQPPDLKERLFVALIIHELLHCVSRYSFNDNSKYSALVDSNTFQNAYSRYKNSAPFNEEYITIENLLATSSLYRECFQRRGILCYITERFSFLGEDVAVANDYSATRVIPLYEEVSKYPQEILRIYNQVLKLDYLVCTPGKKTIDGTEVSVNPDCTIASAAPSSGNAGSQESTCDSATGACKQTQTISTAAEPDRSSIEFEYQDGKVMTENCFYKFEEDKWFYRCPAALFFGRTWKEYNDLRDKNYEGGLFTLLNWVLQNSRTALATNRVTFQTSNPKEGFTGTVISSGVFSIKDNNGKLYYIKSPIGYSNTNWQLWDGIKEEWVSGRSYPQLTALDGKNLKEGAAILFDLNLES